MELSRAQKLEIDLQKAEKKFKELQTEMYQLSMDIHVMQLSLNTLKNISQEK